MKKYSKIANYFLIGYFIANLLRILAILSGRLLFDRAIKDMNHTTPPDIPSVYYFLGETAVPVLLIVSNICAIVLIVLAFYLKIRYKSNLNILEQILKINVFVVVLTLYIIYITSELIGDSPTIYNYCIYNLSSIILILLFLVVFKIISSKNKSINNKTIADS